MLWSSAEVPEQAKTAHRLHPIQRYAAALRRPMPVPAPRPGSLQPEQLELDLSGGLVRLVPPHRYRLLNHRLTEYLLRDCGAAFLRYGFALEKNGIAFLGDLVQLPDHVARRYISPRLMFDQVDSVLLRRELGFGLHAPRWQRPVDRFTHRHWIT